MGGKAKSKSNRKGKNIEPMTLNSFLGAWNKETIRVEEISGSSSTRRLRVVICTRAQKCGYIEREIKQSESGGFICGEYKLDLTQSNSTYLVWVHPDLPEHNSDRIKYWDRCS